jgi:regulator of RNase E activity RraA
MAVTLTHEQLDALKRIDSPTIANAIETFKIRPRVDGYVGMDIKCIFGNLPPMVGYAITCTVDSTTEGRVGIGFNELYKILEQAPKPAVIVMKDVGNKVSHSCHAGEVMSTTMKRLGAVGILTDGGLRDVREVGTLGGFHYFCTGLVVSHGNTLRALIMALRGMTPEEIERFDLSTGAKQLFFLAADTSVIDCQLFAEHKDQKWKPAPVFPH